MFHPTGTHQILSCLIAECRERLHLNRQKPAALTRTRAGYG